MELRHRSLSNLVAWITGPWASTAADRGALLAGPGFDASMLEIWPLLTAAARCTCRRRTPCSATALRAWWPSEGITPASSPTPLAAAVLGRAVPAVGSAVCAVVEAGGDRCAGGSPPVLAGRLVNATAPRRRTVFATWAGSRPRGDGGCRPIGRPLANTASACARPAACGRCRRAWRGSCASAARGWRAATCGRPELTAERFVPDPFGGARRAAVPHGRPRPLAAGRRARVPGPHRPPGEGPRLPHRAGRDRGGAAAAPGRARGRGGGARGRGRRPPARRLRGAAGGSRRRRPASCARTCARALPEYMVPAGFVVSTRCR